LALQSAARQIRQTLKSHLPGVPSRNNKAMVWKKKKKYSQLKNGGKCRANESKRRQTQAAFSIRRVCHGSRPRPCSPNKELLDDEQAIGMKPSTRSD